MLKGDGALACGGRLDHTCALHLGGPGIVLHAGHVGIQASIAKAHAKVMRCFFMLQFACGLE